MKSKVDFCIKLNTIASVHVVGSHFENGLKIRLGRVKTMFKTILDHEYLRHKRYRKTPNGVKSASNVVEQTSVCVDNNAIVTTVFRAAAA